MSRQSTFNPQQAGTRVDRCLKEQRLLRYSSNADVVFCPTTPLLVLLDPFSHLKVNEKQVTHTKTRQEQHHKRPQHGTPPSPQGVSPNRQKQANPSAETRAHTGLA